MSLNQSLLDVREKICSLYKEKEASGEAKTPSRFAGMSVVIKNLEGVIFDLGLNFASLGLGMFSDSPCRNLTRDRDKQTKGQLSSSIL